MSIAACFLRSKMPVSYRLRDRDSALQHVATRAPKQAALQLSINSTHLAVLIKARRVSVYGDCAFSGVAGCFRPCSPTMFLLDGAAFYVILVRSVSGSGFWTCSKGSPSHQGGLLLCLLVSLNPSVRNCHDLERIPFLFNRAVRTRLEIRANDYGSACRCRKCKLCASSLYARSTKCFAGSAASRLGRTSASECLHPDSTTGLLIITLLHAAERSASFSA